MQFYQKSPIRREKKIKIVETGRYMILVGSNIIIVKSWAIILPTVQNLQKIKISLGNLRTSDWN